MDKRGKIVPSTKTVEELRQSEIDFYRWQQAGEIICCGRPKVAPHDHDKHCEDDCEAAFWCVRCGYEKCADECS